jgi:DNA-binding CsgD family transcriptional regulator
MRYAKELLISKRTVEAHRNNIIIKLNAKNSVGIAVKLLQV